jgi:putative membrane protein
MIDIILGIVFGTGLGIVSGIVPGLHINLISIILFAVSGALFGFISPLSLAVMIVSMAIVSNFFEFIKGMFFNVADEGNVLTIHPMAKMLMEKRGIEAIRLVSFGCLSSLFLSVSVFPVMVFIIPVIYHSLRPFIAVLLFGISLHLILREKKNSKFAAIVFAVSGLLGYVVLNLNMQQPLLPLLTGLFGFGVLINSIGKKIPKQMEKVVVDIDRKSALSGSIFGFLSAGILSIIPAIGPTQASLLGSELRKDKMGDEKSLIVSVAGVNVGDIIFSILAMYTLNKPRSGALVVVQDILNVGSYEVLVLLFSCVMAGIIGYFALNKIGRRICENIHRVNHKLISRIIILFVSMMTFYFDMWLGLMVLVSSTFIGYVSNKWDINQSHAMGCLIIPTMLYFM